VHTGTNYLLVLSGNTKYTLLDGVAKDPLLKGMNVRADRDELPTPSAQAVRAAL